MEAKALPAGYGTGGVVRRGGLAPGYSLAALIFAEWSDAVRESEAQAKSGAAFRKIAWPNHLEAGRLFAPRSAVKKSLSVPPCLRGSLLASQTKF